MVAYGTLFACNRATIQTHVCASVKVSEVGEWTINSISRPLSLVAAAGTKGRGS